MSAASLISSSQTFGFADPWKMIEVSLTSRPTHEDWYLTAISMFERLVLEEHQPEVVKSVRVLPSHKFKNPGKLPAKEHAACPPSLFQNV